MSLCQALAREFALGLRIVGMFRENEVAVHVCCDHDEFVLDDGIRKDGLESIGVTCRPSRNCCSRLRRQILYSSIRRPKPRCSLKMILTAFLP